MNWKIIALTVFLIPVMAFGQTLKAYHGEIKDGYNFWVSTPVDYDSAEQGKPMVLFLHGASLCGHNLERVRRYGPLHALAMGRKIDAVIVAPQNPGGAWNPERVNNIVDWVFQNYRIDTNRLYVIGMSLGGYGTIDYSAAYPGRVAAAMALCGGGNPKSYCGLNDLPLWILHGTADRSVGVSQSQKVVNAMSQCGDTARLRFTKLRGMDHGGLARAFYVDETYSWLFEHRLDTPDRPVSQNYDITVELLRGAYRNINRRANHLVVINDKKKSKESVSEVADTTNSSEAEYHTIRKGDTLGALAKRYHTSVNAICRLNGIGSSTTLRIGRRLRVR